MIRLLMIISWVAAGAGNFARTYYLAENGVDSNDGTSASTAWKSLARASSFRFQPGDKILLRGGDVFSGTLLLTEEDSGTATDPLEISSFGTGRATVAAGRAAGLLGKNVEHLHVSELVFKGAGPLTNENCGVWIENNLPDRRLQDLVIDSVDVAGFGRHGIWITGTAFGYEDVQILRSSLDQNLRGGIEVAGRLSWDTQVYAHKNVTISECRAFNNPGDPTFTQNHSGSGIVVYQVDGARVEKCAAWNNGTWCPAKGGGPVGIWTCASRNVVIEYCESFGNHSQGLDGGGFDIDGGSENCVLQYNYTHDNQGPGLMVYTYPYSSFHDRGSIVRFNISVNDAAKSDRYGGLWIRADGNKIEGLEVYNNTIITSGPQAAFVHGASVQAALKNNIFLSGNDGLPLRVDALAQNSAIHVQNNLYWRRGAPFLVQWNDRKLTSLNELQQQARQESQGEAKLGAFVDPQIPVVSGGAETPLPGLHSLVQFKPAPELSQIQGLRLAALGDVPATDFLGHRLQPEDIAPFGAIRAR